MSSGFQFHETEDAQALLQDVLAFLDEDSLNEGENLSPTSVQFSSQNIGDYTKMRRHKVYSPDYERSRREKKKAEREALRSQVTQYETQLELLRLQKPLQNTESRWGWVHAATDEEEKRLKSEKLNHQLKGLLVQQFRVANKFKEMMSHEAGFAQSVLSSCPPCVTPAKLSTFSSLSAMTDHLKSMFSSVRDSTDFVFDSASIFREDVNSIGAIVCSVNLKYDDPIAGSCIELLSSTPLTCNVKSATSMLWKMLLDKEVFGPKSGCYTMKMKQITPSSAQMGYSVSFNVHDASGAVDGVTLMEKIDKDNRSVLVWTSMMVDPEGKPFFRSQVWVSVTKHPTNPENESVVRICSRLSGGHFGVPCDNSSEVNIPVARKHQLMAKSRQERVQLKVMTRAEQQDS
ncbi:hypothetical protein PHPALM_28237 [Phytophthora palmivora]|uniref:M96 mating-specific protein family n=1 Tax=Phytophthora palmivora TaxID=4796 RepID=A0A2P4XAL1_9STRA|nr:hypothetical protein PHPALM_28237 [Phytophthora palmivora]